MIKPKFYTMSDSFGRTQYIYDMNEMDKYLEKLEKEHGLKLLKAEVKGVLNERERASDTETRRLWGDNGPPEPIMGGVGEGW